MPLHDAVGINSKNGVTTENQGSDVKYMGLIRLSDYINSKDCVCVLSDLT